MLNYTVQPIISVFDGATLTGAYTGNQNKMDISGMSKLSLDIDYTRGSGELSSKLQFQIEHSTDGTNWYKLSIDSTSTTTILTARVWEVEDTASLNIILDVAYKFVRISAQESGVTTNAGTVTMTATPAGQ